MYYRASRIPRSLWSHILIIGCLAHTAAALESGCFASDAALTANCAGRPTKWKCLQFMGYVSPALNKTCEWRVVGSSSATVEANYLAKSTGAFDAGHAFDGYCQAEVQTFVNAKARGRWTMFASALAGPGRSSKPSEATFVKASVDTPMAGCTTDASCKALVGAPSGGSGTYDLAFTFFATDPLIKRTQDQFVFKFKARHTLKKSCGEGKALSLVADHVDFGPTEFMVQEGLPGNKRYFLQSYRAYKISGVRGARWSVRVSRDLGSGTGKTPMIVLLMREEDYKKWSYGCTTTCAPPIGQALPGTISTAVVANGRVNGLDPAGTYRLMVAYPRVHHDTWENTFWYQPIDFNEFNKQQLTVEVWAA